MLSLGPAESVSLIRAFMLHDVTLHIDLPNTDDLSHLCDCKRRQFDARIQLSFVERKRVAGRGNEG